MAEELIQIRKLEIRAGEKQLVKNINLDIYKGETLGLVGESGSGKTLSSLSILGLLPKNLKVSSGNIFLHSDKEAIDILKLSEKDLNRIRGNKISMIFQEPMSSLNPSMRCGKQAMEAYIHHKKTSLPEAKKRILELFKEVLLPDPERAFSSWPHELSGGQRQRVMIAMALSTSPDLLIADEPTTALDVTVQKSILKLLKNLRAKYRMSILFISHDLHVVNEIADRVAVMYDGNILERGEKTTVFERPQHPYTKGLLACKPNLETSTYRLPTVEDFIQNKKGTEIETMKKAEPLSEKNPILIVNNLEVSFGSKKKEVKAVKSVSFDVYKGETLGLVGESGCGKTSLGRSILQLVEMSAGSVEYNGRTLNHLRGSELRKLRKNIQIVFQDPYSSLNPGKTIASIISEPMKIHGLIQGKKEREEACIELLGKVGIPSDSMNLYPHQFSGGQRQRIGIARALACQPEFIILDESVSALDVSVQAQVLNLLNDLKDEYRLTYIFISHDLTVVKYMSDRIMVMSEGRIIEEGDPETLYRKPEKEYTRTLIESIPSH